MGTESFSWLHLTDFHFGLEGQGFLWPNLRGPFLEDLERLHRLAGPWDAVLFTGDLVQSGDPSQFQEVQPELLERIWSKLKELGSGDAVLLAVPGNHDLQRPDQEHDNAARDALLRKDGLEGIADKFWNNPTSEYRRVVDNAFAAYQAWWSDAKQRPKSGIANGILPGDFAYTFERGNRRIGIIGLNTTALQLQGGDYREHLVWDARQLHGVSGGAIDDWVSKHDVCLLLTHQGPDWLTPTSRAHGETEIAPADRFAVHLFGHMHETKISYLSTGGGPSVRRCQGCSVFGMEKFGEPPSILRTHGYAAGRIDFRQKDGTLRIWPRIATKGTGPWRFIPDHTNADLVDEATRPETIFVRLDRPFIPAPTYASVEHQSDFIKIPAPDWPEELAKKGFEMPDSLLLRPESRVVGFHRERESLLDTVIGWALDPTELVKLRLQAGAGGSGKTRLLIEVCDRLEKIHGWRAGFLERSRSVTDGFRVLLKEGKPTLVVLDYAESRSSEIVELVRTVLNFPNSSQVRFVLLARDGGDWWDHLGEGAAISPATSAILQGINTKTGPYRMVREQIEKDARQAIFESALGDFAKYKNIQIPLHSSPDLSEDFFGNPLFIHLAALATLRGSQSGNNKDLISVALGHERSYWRQLFNSMGLPEQLAPAFEQAVAAFTLVGGKSTAKEARELLARVPRARDLDPQVRHSLFDALRRLYRFDGGVGTLQPDVLGESLVSDALASDDELLDVTLGKSNSNNEIRYGLTVLTRLGRRVPFEQRWLRLGLERYLTDISVEAYQVGVETGSPMPEIHAQVLKNANQSDQRRALEILRPVLSHATAISNSLGIEVKRQAANLLERRKTGSLAKRHIASFEALSSLADSLREHQLFTEAAVVALEAVSHAEKVFRSGDERDRSRLANSLCMLSISLGQVSRFQQALERAEQGEKIFRSLAEKNPTAQNNDSWATALNILSKSLKDVGRFREALLPAEKAENIYRMLFEKRPNTGTRQDLALSLVNLSNRLRNVGRFQEALERAQQAESTYRALVEKQPDAQNSSSWAGSLHNLSINLSELGHFEEGLKYAEKSESINRSLAAKQPDAYNDDWAQALGNLSTRLTKVGRYQEALELGVQCEAMYRALAEKQPDAFNASWAGSLDSLAISLIDVGRLPQALEYVAQAENIYRALAEKQPDAFNADLARCLGNFSIPLSNAGRSQEALDRARQSENIYRELAHKQPDAFNADWATALSNLAEVELSAGNPASALETSIEALAKIIPLAEDYPHEYKRWIGFTRRIMAEAELNLGRIEDGLSEAKRAADIWTELAIKGQNYTPVQVAKSFRVLVQLEIANRQRGNVVATLAQAFQILRKSLEINPQPLRATMLELISLASTVDGTAVETAVPKDLLVIVKSLT